MSSVSSTSAAAITDASKESNACLNKALASPDVTSEFAKCLMDSSDRMWSCVVKQEADMTSAACGAKVPEGMFVSGVAVNK